MTTYILRRLLLMVPTIVGITFLVFYLIASAPGGVGQADMSGGEGQEAGVAEAARQAYLEDKYGLGDPIVTQYARWLGRASPLKFGTQAMRDPAGTVIYPPKRLAPPPKLGDWYAEDAEPLPQPAGQPLDFSELIERSREEVLADLDLEDILERARRQKAIAQGGEAAEAARAGDQASLPELTDVEYAAAVEAAVEQERERSLARAKVSAYRAAESEYARQRAAFVQARIALETAAAAYARERRAELRELATGLTREASIRKREARGEEDEVTRDLLEQAEAAEREAEVWRKATTADEKPIWDRMERAGVDFDSPEGQAIIAAGEEAYQKYKEALEARARLANAYASRPFDKVGEAFGVPLGIPNTVTLAAPDLGFSYSKSRPVLDLILERLPVTLMLNLIAVPIIYFIAVPSGMLAAVKRGTFVDVASGALFVALWSIPVVWAGVLLLGYLASDAGLGAFPTGGLNSADADTYPFLPQEINGEWQHGWLLDRLWHVCLPVVCLVYAGFAVISKQTRAAMLDNFNADYVRTAKAKGVKNNDVVFRHVFRNSLLPLITMFATIFPAMLAGSVVVERIFTIPGMGSLMIEAIYLKDRELLLANTLMVGVVNLLALLLADILYALADPRITYD
jgi:peptide/nickel transport system permease protein